MKKHTIRAYLTGVFTAFLLFALIVPGFAESVNKQLTAAFNGVSIYINGTKLEPKDANGNAVQPFVVDGTTYLPVRAVADAAGYDVKYDASTNSIALSTKTETTASPSPSTSSANFDKTLRNDLSSRITACIVIAYNERQSTTITDERKKLLTNDSTNMVNLRVDIMSATTNEQLAQYEKQVEYYETLYK